VKSKKQLIGLAIAETDMKSLQTHIFGYIIVTYIKH